MNMRPETPSVRLKSAYQQLDAVERAFVDSYVFDIQDRAEVSNRSAREIAQEPVPAYILMTSRKLVERQLVQAAIFERVSEFDWQSGLSPWKIIAELQNLMHFNIGDYMNVDLFSGKKCFDLTQCTDEQLKRLSEATLKEGRLGDRELKIKGYDKLKVFEMLLKFMGAAESGNKYWFEYETFRRSKKRMVKTDVKTGDDAASLYSSELNR